MNRGMLLVIVTLACILSITISNFKHVQQERDVYRENVQTLLDSLREMRIDSTRTAYTVGRLRLEKDEFEKRYREDAETIKKLNLRIKDLQSVSKVGVEVEAPIQAPLKRQTIEPLDIQPIVLSYFDAHRTVNLIVNRDSISGYVRMNANLSQYVYLVHKHRFLWWRWGVKGIRQTIVSDNPYVKIGYNEYIEIE